MSVGGMEDKGDVNEKKGRLEKNGRDGDLW